MLIRLFIILVIFLISACNENGFEQLPKLFDMTHFKLLSFDEANEKYEIQDYLGGGYKGFVRVYEGNLNIEGNLDLDYYTRTGWFGSEDGMAIGMLVTGHLTVKGTIGNYEGDYGPFLIVGGNVKAKNLIGGGSEIIIDGNAEIENVVLGHYNHGVLNIGQVTARVLICSDHAMSIDKVEAITINYRGTLEKADFTEDDIEKILVSELLDPEDGYFNESKLREKLSENPDYNCLKAGAKTTQQEALEYLQEIIKSQPNITQLDLSDKKLEVFPAGILKLTALKSLTLNENPISHIPKEIKTLSNLEELYLYDCDLKELPKEIGELRNLKIFDVSSNYLSVLPSGLDNLTKLQELSLYRNRGIKLTDQIIDLENLEILNLSPIASLENLEILNISSCNMNFPKEILGLKKLKVLDISDNNLTEIPQAITQLENLEVLNLNHALGNVKTLPDLSKLKNLTAIYFDGGRSYTDFPFPKHSLLFELLNMNLPQLEELYIDRWGKEEMVRKDLKTLPEAIGNFTNLKEIDISFCGLEKLPDSFYKLKNLEYINLEYNSNFSLAEIERLTKAYPQTKINLRNIDTKRTLTDSDIKKVHQLVKKASQQMSREQYKQANDTYNQALAVAKKTNKYTDYDYLYAHYGKLYCYSHSFIPEEQDKNKKMQLFLEFEKMALDTLPLISEPIWHFTDEGAFQEEILREAYGGLSWYLYERTPKEDKEALKTALNWAEKAIQYVEDQNHYFLLDTKVRILLALGKKEEAYKIVERVLNEAPYFGDFQDIKQSKQYKEWKK